MREIFLDECDWFPADARTKLREHRQVLGKASDMEELSRLPWARQVALQLDAVARANRVVCYYCTREIEPGYLKSHGLPTLTLEGHQRAFLKSAGSRFTPDEIASIRDAWNHYWAPFKCQDKPVKTLLTLDRRAPRTDLSRGQWFFGGAAVFYPLTHIEPIARKLAGIGEPVVARIALPGFEIRTSGDCGLGRAALSHYHCTINPMASRDGPEGYVKRTIRPSDVREVIHWSTYLDTEFERGSDLPWHKRERCAIVLAEELDM